MQKRMSFGLLGKLEVAHEIKNRFSYGTLTKQ